MVASVDKNINIKSETKFWCKQKLKHYPRTLQPTISLLMLLQNIKNKCVSTDWNMILGLCTQWLVNSRSKKNNQRGLVYQLKHDPRTPSFVKSCCEVWKPFFLLFLLEDVQSSLFGWPMNWWTPCCPIWWLAPPNLSISLGILIWAILQCWKKLQET